MREHQAGCQGTTVIYRGESESQVEGCTCTTTEGKMEKKMDGGPAFPQPAYTIDQPNQRIIAWAEGMTLRDYAAIKAMQGLVARLDADQIIDTEGIVQDALVLADDYLKARG